MDNKNAPCYTFFIRYDSGNEASRRGMIFPAAWGFFMYEEGAARWRIFAGFAGRIREFPGGRRSF